MTLPIERPRLAGHVQARFHLTGAQEKVVLHDPRSGLVLEVTPDDWRLLEACDGTRDLDALCLATAKIGRYRGEGAIEQLIGELVEAGVLVDGLPPPPITAPVTPPETPADRPLEMAPDYRFSCDGQGSCCRFYGSIPFMPVDALSARLHAADRPMPIAPQNLFLPVSGAHLDPAHPAVVAQVNGRCVFLNADERCDIHASSGAEAKPTVCQTYPAVFVDDGEVVRVSATPECACIFDSAESEGGERLLPDTIRLRGDLHPLIAPGVVPDPVPLTLSRTAPRSALRAWSRTAHDIARAADRDAAGWALALAEGMTTRGLDEIDVPSLPLDGLRPWIAAFRSRAASVAQTQDGWRHASDLSRQVARWIADALDSQDPFTAEPRPREEGFYLAMLMWGHRLSTGGRPLGHSLRDRATRILTARAMRLVPAPEDISSEHPLALVEAAVRNLSIAGYANEL